MNSLNYTLAHAVERAGFPPDLIGVLTRGAICDNGHTEAGPQEFPSVVCPVPGCRGQVRDGQWREPHDFTDARWLTPLVEACGNRWAPNGIGLASWRQPDGLWTAQVMLTPNADESADQAADFSRGVAEARAVLIFVNDRMARRESVQ